MKKFNLLEIFGEDIYFPDGKGKHKNEIMAELCKKYNVDNAEAVYIGDTPSDIIEARKAKIPSIAIGRDEASWSRLKNFSPNYLTETLDSILAIERNFPCIS